MAIIKIKSVKKDIVLPVQFHSSYYYQIRDSLILLLNRQEDPKQALINAASSLEMTLDESVIQIFMAIIKEFEITAKEADQLVDEDIEVEDEDINKDPS